jgi:hypothetical protein
VKRQGKTTPTTVIGLRTDEHGNKTFGNPENGCVYCGEVVVKIGKDDNLIFFHPGVLCCLPKVRLQREYRLLERTRLMQEASAIDRVVTDLYDAIDLAPSNAAAEAARAHAERAEKMRPVLLAGIEHRMREIDEEWNEINTRLRELEKAQEGLEGE